MGTDLEVKSEKARELIEIGFVLKDLGFSKDEIKRIILEYLLK